MASSAPCHFAHIVLRAADPRRLPPLLCPLVRSSLALFCVSAVPGWATCRISQGLSDLRADLCPCVLRHAQHRVLLWENKGIHVQWACPSWVEGVLGGHVLMAFCFLVQNWGPGNYLVMTHQGWLTSRTRLGSCQLWSGPSIRAPCPLDLTAQLLLPSPTHPRESGASVWALMA